MCGPLSLPALRRAITEGRHPHRQRNAELAACQISRCPFFYTALPGVSAVSSGQNPQALQEKRKPVGQNDMQAERRTAGPPQRRVVKPTVTALTANVTEITLKLTIKLAVFPKMGRNPVNGTREVEHRSLIRVADIRVAEEAPLCALVLAHQTIFEIWLELN